jgi:hypothetical protein
LSNLLADLKDEETIDKYIQLEAAFDGQGIKYVRWATKRFTNEQYALWCQGRKSLLETNAARFAADMPPLNAADNLYTVTECDGTIHKSQHQFGNAVDYVVLDKYGKPTWDYINYASEYRALRDVGTALGFNCGGSWMKMDNGKDSSYIKVNLGWDPPHIQVG